jgi:hypothetical protein
MKKTLALLFIISTINLWSQTRKIEITALDTGKSVYFETAQMVKVTTDARKTYKGILAIQDENTIIIDNKSIKLDSINSIKNESKKGQTLKKVVLGTGLGILATSGIVALSSNESAVSLFFIGSGTTIVGGLLGRKNKTYIKNRNTFKIVGQ